MLKRTVTDIKVVVCEPDLLRACEAFAIPAVMMPDSSTGMEHVGVFENVHVICVDEVKAYELADKVVRHGADSMNVEYVDLDAYPNGARTLLEGGISRVKLHARDIYFDEIRPLADAKEDPTLMERIPCGIEFLDDYIKWRRREICVVIGPYGCGKSLLIQMLALKWAEGKGSEYEDGTKRKMSVWLCTWEDDPIEQKDQILRHYTNGSDCPADWQVDQAKDMQRRILHTNPELMRDRGLDWYIERARHMNHKFGTNFFVLDPWSEFDHVRERDQIETEYVKQMMKELSKLSIELDAIFVVVTHIGKSKYSEDGGIRPFRVADAMGSVQFGSSAARGICVMRTSDLIGSGDHMIVHFDKIKVERTMGRKGTLALRYHEDCHKLIHCLDASRIASDAWNGKKRKAKGDKTGAEANSYAATPVFNAQVE